MPTFVSFIAGVPPEFTASASLATICMFLLVIFGLGGIAVLVQKKFIIGVIFLAIAGCSYFARQAFIEAGARALATEYEKENAQSK
jgi:hypothetical protein